MDESVWHLVEVEVDDEHIELWRIRSDLIDDDETRSRYPYKVELNAHLRFGLTGRAQRRLVTTEDALLAVMSSGGVLIAAVTQTNRRTWICQIGDPLMLEGWMRALRRSRGVFELGGPVDHDPAWEFYFDLVSDFELEQPEPGTPRPDGTVAAVLLIAKPDRRRLHVIVGVADAEEHPVEGAVVTVGTRTGLVEASGRSNADGIATIDLEVGDVETTPDVCVASIEAPGLTHHPWINDCGFEGFD